MRSSRMDSLSRVRRGSSVRAASAQDISSVELGTSFHLHPVTILTFATQVWITIQ